MEKKCASCGSCGMPLERPEDHALGDVSHPYCRYCTDTVGKLLPYEHVLRTNADYFVESQGVTPDAATRMARELLGGMPAWRGHS